MKFYRSPFYYVIFCIITIIYVTAALAVSLFKYNFFTASEEIKHIIETHISGNFILLNSKQKSFSVNFDALFVLSYFCVGFTIIYLIIFRTFFYLCFSKIKTSMNLPSPRTRANHLMLFRCVIFQCSAVIF